MSDFSELKKLAEALIASDSDADFSGWMDASDAFENAFGPEVVLALIAELENFKAEVPKWTEREILLIAKNERLRTAEGDAMTYKAGMENVAQQRDQLRAELAGLRTGYEAFERVNAELKTENEVLRKEREGKVLIPAEPSPGLLMSMAVRNDHALGCPGYYDQKVLGRGFHDVSHARMVECALSEMRKLHEEVVGAGFYSPEKEAGYVAMSKEAGHE